MIMDFAFLTGLAILLLRISIAVIFFSSGRSHAQNPIERGKSIGMSPAVTRILGVAEIIAALSLALGIFTQFGAIIIIATMIGAIYKKAIVWKTGFYADKGFGWHYDLLILVGALVIFATAGGKWVLF